MLYQLQKILETNPAGVRLFVRRAQILLQTQESNPFQLAGALDREHGENTAAVLLFRSATDVGTSRARQKTGWEP